LQDKFIQKLVGYYGPWEKSTSRFGNATFCKIAEDLCISASQFSKLLYGTATEGMYSRSIRSIDRLIQEEKHRQEREETVSKWKTADH